MTSRTLKYSHDAVCSANEKREVAPKKVVEPITTPAQPQPPTMNDVRAHRMRVRQEKIQKLIVNAF